MLKNLFQLKATRQTVVLFAAQIINALLGVAVTGMNARALSVEEYGLFTFALVLILFVAWFFDFGFFSAGSRIVALAKDRIEERKIVGSLIVLCLILGIGFSIVLLVLSLFLDSMFRTNVGS